MIAFASPCSRMKPTVAESRRVLIVLTTVPSIGTARVASQAAGTLGAMTETVSPRPIPRAARLDARRRQRAYVSAQVWRRLPCTIDGRSG